MKHNLLCLIALMQFSIALSEPITMPNEAELQNRLNAIGMDHRKDFTYLKFKILL